ncbi:ATP-binding protein [Rahnella inusitata]|uniref:ATP-binding protein n=1 Tax=Rahnella inusitata TaxID=58169 RepID=A0ABX9NYC8_9GAMM|nr:ATP-binding protein [Rahnella inusitata]RJT11554.1 ATP-binding protein [Rahnella inusitata]
MNSHEELLAPIEIRPEVNILSVLRHLNYKPWYAIAEFIDNAIQSSIANKDKLNDANSNAFKLKIDIRLDATLPGQLIICDNAAGISTSDFPRAFRTAQLPDDRTGLSEFGMGMKSAACWFSDCWNVRTKAIGEKVERSITFDVKKIVDENIDNLNTQTNEVDANYHYTVVSLRRLHHIPQGRTIGKIKEHLCSIYRVFLRDGNLEINFNGEPLCYKSPSILKALKYISPGIVDKSCTEPIEWRKDIKLDLGNGLFVKGFVALREIGSTHYAGFALFRRGRLIIGSSDETYRPEYIFKRTNSFQYQRLFGELYVEGFEVSHTKDGFRWEGYEDIFLERLREEIENPPLDLISQAENYRSLPTRKSIEKQAELATAVVAEYIENNITPLLTEIKEHPEEPSVIMQEMAQSSLQASEKIVKVYDGSFQWVITLRTSVDPARDEWVSMAKMQEEKSDNTNRIRRLFIDLSLAHPFSTKFLGTSNENIELFLRIASVVCISLILSEDITGESPESFLHHFNYLLRGALTRTVFENDNID